MVARTYRELVAEGRRVVERAAASRFKLGDLALEVAPEYPEDAARLEKWASDIGESYTVIRQARDTSRAWPPKTRTSTISWSVYYELASNPDRVEILKEFTRGGKRATVDGIRAALGKATSHGPLERTPQDTEERAEKLRELARDPQAIRAAMSDPEVAGAFAKESIRRANAAVSDNTGPTVLPKAQRSAVLVIGAMRESGRRIADALEMLRSINDLTNDEVAQIQEEAKKLSMASTWFASALNGADLDDEIRDLLESGRDA